MSLAALRDLLGPAPVELHDCGAGRFWAREGGAVRLVDADDALLLESIHGFRTAEEHARRLAGQGFVEASAGDLVARMTDLRASGLVLSAETFLQRLPRRDQPAARAGWVAWVTRDRPSLVCRSVQSWIAAHGASVGLAVVDDSQDDGTRDALLRIGASDLWYAGVDEKRRFVDRLVARGIPAEVLSFALFPHPDPGTAYGANRNAVLLATAGEAALSSDDDILFEAAALPEATSGLAVTSRLDPTVIRCYSDEQGAREGLGPGGDLLASHEALLGRDVAERARAAAGAVALESLGRDLAHRLYALPHRVLLTAPGLYGASATRSSSVLHLSGESWQLATASENAYKAARAARHLQRLVRLPSICDCGYVSACHFGLDNRELLPPFFPAGRREDSIFALTVAAIHPEALTAHLPVAVLHDPPPRADGGEGTAPAPTADPPQPLFADVLSLLIGSCAPGPAARGREARMRALAGHLAGMASLEAGDLEKWVRERWVGHWASEMALCEERVEEGPAGAPWVRDSAARLEQIEAHIEAGAAVHPRDLGGGDREAAWAHARDRVRRFAGLLEWWPVIVAASRELKQAGQGLLRPLHP